VPDIATLGLAVDSSKVVAAKKALDDLTGAAKPAAAAAANLEKAGAAAAKGGAAIAKSGALARHEMVNLSRQISDVGVSLVSGQSPFMVLAQQGTQIADIFGSSKTGTVGGAFKQVISGIGAARLAALGFVGVAAGAAFAVKGLADGAKDFDDLARSVGAARGELHGLQQVASNKGIGSDEFAKVRSSSATQFTMPRTIWVRSAHSCAPTARALPTFKAPWELSPI
jgi:phage-related minor tail protein